MAHDVYKLSVYIAAVSYCDCKVNIQRPKVYYLYIVTKINKEKNNGPLFQKPLLRTCSYHPSVQSTKVHGNTWPSTCATCGEEQLFVQN